VTAVRSYGRTSLLIAAVSSTSASLTRFQMPTWSSVRA
jgi:hypothetical protein